MRRLPLRQIHRCCFRSRRLYQSHHRCWVSCQIPRPVCCRTRRLCQDCQTLQCRRYFLANQSHRSRFPQRSRYCRRKDCRQRWCQFRSRRCGFDSRIECSADSGCLIRILRSIVSIKIQSQMKSKRRIKVIKASGKGSSCENSELSNRSLSERIVALAFRHSHDESGNQYRNVKSIDATVPYN